MSIISSYSCRKVEELFFYYFTSELVRLSFDWFKTDCLTSLFFKVIFIFSFEGGLGMMILQSFAASSDLTFSFWVTWIFYFESFLPIEWRCIDLLKPDPSSTIWDSVELLLFYWKLNFFFGSFTGVVISGVVILLSVVSLLSAIWFVFSSIIS